LLSAGLLVGFAALFFPPEMARGAPLLWGGAALVFTALAYSMATLTHQAWGARLPGGAAGQASWMAWREGAGLLGVVAASVLPSLVGWAATTAVLALGFALALIALHWAPAALGEAASTGARVRPQAGHAPELAPTRAELLAPWRRPGWRALIGVYMANGIANAIPATLVLFFVRDRLQAPEREAAFLAVYFVAATLSLPLWVRVAARLGLVRTWQLSMRLAVLAFVGAFFLGAGDTAAFFVVCAATGAALGADLMAPPALLAQWLRSAEETPSPAGADRAGPGSLDGVAFGWWGAATKLNLALAAGLVLPALDLAGYAPGVQSAAALSALSLAYCLVPCALKLLALGLLSRWAPAPRGPVPDAQGVVDASK
jgi:Na+/melibiose symporter-like transporter